MCRLRTRLTDAASHGHIPAIVQVPCSRCYPLKCCPGSAETDTHVARRVRQIGLLLNSCCHLASWCSKRATGGAGIWLLHHAFPHFSLPTGRLQGDVAQLTFGDGRCLVAPSACASHSGIIPRLHIILLSTVRRREPMQVISCLCETHFNLPGAMWTACEGVFLSTCPAPELASLHVKCLPGT